jgi:hypothetical protein
MFWGSVRSCVVKLSLRVSVSHSGRGDINNDRVGTNTRLSTIECLEALFEL